MPENEIVPTPTIGRVRKALSQAKTTVSDVLRAARPEAGKVELATTPIPKDPGLNEDAWDAVERIAGLLGELELPDKRRMLTKPELEQITRVYDQLQTGLKGFDRARTQIKTAVFNHFDAVAAHDGKITEETHFTKEGWAVIEDKISAVVEGLDKALFREVSGGKISLPLDGLRGLVEDEKLLQKDFLSMTRQIRVVDEDRVMAWLRANPDRAEILAEATVVSKGNASFWLRDNE